MTIEFKLQEVSEGVESVDIAEIMVSPGDVIDARTIICEIETDKAVAEIECPHAGTIKEILVSEGESVAIGTPLLVIEESASSNEAPPANGPAANKTPKSTPTATQAPVAGVKTSAVVEFVLQELSEGITTVEVAEVMVSAGDVIESAAIICEVETDKAVAEIECPHTGTITAVHISDGDTIEIGAPLITIETTRPAAAVSGTEPATAGRATPAKPSVPAKNARRPAPAGPSTRRLARKLGVDLSLVTGSAHGGRITIEDVESFVRGRLTRPIGGSEPLNTGLMQSVALPDFSQFGPVDREPLNKICRSTARNLHNAWLTIPHVTQHDLADVTQLELTRRQYLKSKPKSPRITMTAIVIKAIVGTLKEFPHFNSSLDMATGERVLKRYYHIGVAVDTPNGLVVPVIRDCDQKNVLQVAADIADLAKRAMERKLTSAEMRGASFTITNLGGIGGTYFTPIVNHPEVAILGLSRSRKQLKLVDGEVMEQLMIPLSLSYDHRAINGADAARFLVNLSDSLTNQFELF